MYQIFSPLVSFFKKNTCNIYDLCFLLHHRITVTILLAFCVLLSSAQFFGNPIDCISASHLPKQFVDNFCWVTGTYTDRRGYQGEIGKNILSYGNAVMSPTDYHHRNYQKYYQWIVIMLLIQAASFSLPAYLWKVWEKNIMKQLTDDLRNHLMAETCPKDRLDLVAKYVTHNENQLGHSIYALRYLLAEFCNYLVLIGNIMLINYFLPGFWLNFLPAINVLLSFEYENWASETSKFFPKLAKCEFFNVGPSGSVQVFDSYCLLPLNVLNEKIYAFLYLWFITLFFVSSLNLIYKLAMVLFRPLRLNYFRVFHRHSGSEVKWSDVVNEGHYGTWFLLKQLAANLSANVFKEVVQIISATERSEYYLQ